jgi:hypothetical protein
MHRPTNKKLAAPRTVKFSDKFSDLGGLQALNLGKARLGTQAKPGAQWELSWQKHSFRRSQPGESLHKKGLRQG